MSKSIAIVNPVGRQWYTSLKKAHEYVARNRAVIEDGMLRFLDPMHRSARESDGAVVYWNGSMGAFKMHRPGEVVS